jgi:hypothetical protein
MYLELGYKILTVLAAGTIATALPAQSKPAKDPNEKICQNESVIGSRLAVRRVCATRAEWAERRRLDREAIDQGQRSACMITTTSRTGQAAC